jgi:membrane-associated phospholipid phosphatase
VKSLFKENLLFLIPFLIIVIIASICLFLFSKAEIHLFFNSYHNNFFDFFFKYWTHTGHGLFPIIITLILLLIRYRWAVLFAIANILIGIIIQLLKRVVFFDYYRPVRWFNSNFGDTIELFVVKGAEPGWFYSFPSGHSATAFGVFFLLSIFTKSSVAKILFFVAALLSAYSRIYLSWHFLGDVVVGSLIGLLISLFTYLLFYKKSRTAFDGSLLKSIKKSDK